MNKILKSPNKLNKGFSRIILLLITLSLLVSIAGIMAFLYIEKLPNF